MILYNIKLIFRNLLKNKLFSIINILGLSIGLSASILIYLWISNELSYDKFHNDYERIYRIYFSESGEFPITLSNMPPGLIPVAIEEIPEIEKGFRFDRYSSTIKYDDKIFKEYLYFIDPDMFEVLYFPFKKGTLTEAFKDVNSIVLTQKSAKKYFGDSNPIGKVVLVDGTESYIVTGVINDIPLNSSIQPDFIISMNNLKEFGYNSNGWNDWAWQSYVKISKTADPELVEMKLNEVVKKNTTRKEATLHLQPLKNKYLYFLDGKPALLKSIYIFSLIAVIIILIACFNYMNLSTAMLISKAKNTAIQKILGASRKKIIWQFLFESISFAFISIFIALILVESVRNPFSNLIKKNLTIDYTDFNIMIIVISITVFVGIIAGIYPAIKLSSFKPIIALKGFNAVKSDKSSLRKVLVILQFTVSSVLIASTLIVSKQMNYTLNKNLGIDYDNIIYFQINDKLKDSYEIFKSDLLGLSNIQAVTRTFQMPSYNKLSVNAKWPGMSENTNVRMNVSIGDYDYVKVFGLEPLEGRNFSQEFTSDSVNILINEEAAKQMSLQNPVGTPATILHDGEIIGVLKDYHFMPLNTKIEPIAIVIDKSFYKICAVKLNGKDLKRTLKHIESTYKKYVDNFPFDYQFMKDDYEEIYKAEIQLKKLYKYFSFLAIFIACLGLFGLSSYIAENKTKEIAIRKANGASVMSIIYLLNKEFLKWVLIAVILGVPFTYFWMQKWLQNFVYHISIGSFEFIISAIISLFIAFVTIAFHAYKAANRNPVESLRYE